MFLLSSIVYQFVAARSHRATDPEADPGPPQETSDADPLDEGAGNLEPDSANDEHYSSGPNAGLRNDHVEDDADVEEDTSDEIIRQLEQEEYPDEQPKRRALSRFKTWSSFSSRRSSLPTSASLLWSKIKAALDPRTSPGELEFYAPHYRYMPIISGMVIPLSILLEVPGLTEDWYIRTVDNKTVETRPNTVVLDVGLAISMLFGVFANICLILRFLEKKVKYMTILCVILLTIHDIINITAVTIFGVEHRFSDGFTYGQGFWMVVCSTTCSTFTNITLLVDLFQTPHFSTSGSGLTRKQRTLVISVMVLMCYIALGAMVQTFLLDVTFLDALYFTVVTIETIGFGDIPPKTAGARIFTCFYLVFGIINLALTVGLARETVVEAIEVGYRKRVQNVQKRRRLIVRERRILRRWRAAVEYRLNQIGEPVWVEDLVHEHSFLGRLFDKIWPWPRGNGPFFRYDATLGYGEYAHPHGMHLNLEALSWPQLESAAMEAGTPLHTLLPPGFKSNKPLPSQFAREPRDGSTQPSFEPSLPDPPDVPLTHARLGRMTVLLSNFALAVNYTQFSRVPRRTKPTPLQMQVRTPSGSQPKRSVSERYEALRSTMEKEEKRAFFVRLGCVWAIFLVFWTVGSGIFMVAENWSYGSALYFCFISFTTVGYGDLTPRTPAGRSLFVVWALLGVATMTTLISIISDAYSTRYKRIFHSNLFSRIVQQYQKRKRDNENVTAGQESEVVAATTLERPDTADEKVTSPKTIDEAVEDSRKRAEGHLATLPQELRRQARSFNENVQYLINEPHSSALLDMDMPDGLKQLMNDVAGVEKLGGRIKQEILKDASARNTLLAISVEQALRRMVSAAEEAIEAIKERDRLVELRSASEDVNFNIPVSIISPGPQTGGDLEGSNAKSNTL